jgi:hypothetical protein
VVRRRSAERRLLGRRFRFIEKRYGNVNVFEDAARSDAEHAVGGFDEVVTFASAVLAAEMIDEGEVGSELFGFDQETCAIGLPFLRFHVALPRVRVVRLNRVNPTRFARPVGIEMLCASEGDCTSETGVGQFSIFGAVEEKSMANFSRIETGEVSA